jgi:hypothetical protein
MPSNETPTVKPGGPFSYLAVCPKCSAHPPASVEVDGGGHDRSAVALRPSEASAIIGIGAGVLCLVMLYFTAGLMGVVVTLGIVGLCLVA